MSRLIRSSHFASLALLACSPAIGALAMGHGDLGHDDGSGGKFCSATNGFDSGGGAQLSAQMHGTLAGASTENDSGLDINAKNLGGQIAYPFDGGRPDRQRPGHQPLS